MFFEFAAGAAAGTSVGTDISSADVNASSQARPGLSPRRCKSGTPSLAPLIMRGLPSFFSFSAQAPQQLRPCALALAMESSQSNSAATAERLQSHPYSPRRQSSCKQRQPSGRLLGKPSVWHHFLKHDLPSLVSSEISAGNLVDVTTISNSQLRHAVHVTAFPESLN